MSAEVTTIGGRWRALMCSRSRTSSSSSCAMSHFESTKMVAEFARRATSATCRSCSVMPSVGVDQDECDVGAACGLERAHLAPELDLLALRAMAAQAGGVDQAVDAVAALQADVDRVARRAGDLADDRALLVAERVQQRRLADVGATEDGDADLVGRALDARDVRARAGARRSRRAGRPWRCRAAPRARRGRRGRARGTRAPRRGGPGCRACWPRAGPARASAAGAAPAPDRPRRARWSRRRAAATRSASLIASSAWRTISLWKGPSSPASTPPVSISANSSPPHSTTICLRSRVTPGSEWTTVSRVAVSRLTSVDLPAFGSPTIATVPSSVRSVCASASAVRCRELRERGASSLMRQPARRRPRGRAGARPRWPPASGAEGAPARAGALLSW